MSTNADLVVITSSTPFVKRGGRSALSRLVLPSSVVPGEFFFPRGDIWWVEQSGSHAWLRGHMQVQDVREEILPNDSARRLVWYLSSNSERLTHPGSHDYRGADVSSLLADHPTARGSIRVGVLSPEITNALSARRRHLAECVWSFDWARKHVHHLVEQTHLTQAMQMLKANFDAALIFARTHFVRAELVSLPDKDVYEVAAAVLAGFDDVPQTCTHATSLVADDDHDVMLFHELGADEIACVERVWQRTQNPHSLDRLEQSDKRHQLILKSLANLVRAGGLTPTYNRFVDLRVEVPPRELFFEIKTATPGNFLHQVRLAAGQLLEYRFRRQKNGDQSVELIAVIEDNCTESDCAFARQFLTSLDITLVCWDEVADYSEDFRRCFFR